MMPLSFIWMMLLAGIAAGQESSVIDDIGRSSFPTGFQFGTAGSSYQYEGGAYEGGKGPSVWDTTSHTFGKVLDGSNGDVACDSYHKYEEDVELMSEMGLDAYRFSIAWSRIFPVGNGTVNQEGVDFYTRLIDCLLDRGIQPYVTLYHWDMPQALMDTLGGWSNPKMVPIFTEYAETCFRSFGDRVKHWITFNEPANFVGENWGCKAILGECRERNSSTRRYLAAHNVILAHGSAVQVYRDSFQSQQNGVIGITIDIQWFEPLTDSPEDAQAASNAMALHSGWFLDPIFLGDYPGDMRKILGDDVPSFSTNESMLVRNSVDFLGVNHYTSYYTTYKPTFGFTNLTPIFPWKSGIYIGVSKDGNLIGPVAGSFWLYIVPTGMEKVLNWVKSNFGNPIVYITENGVSEINNPLQPFERRLQDDVRIKYYHDYLYYALAAIREGVDVRGYFAWSLLDNFEWQSGYTVRFGLHYVDFADNQKRYPKASVNWFKKFLRN